MKTNTLTRIAFFACCALAASFGGTNSTFAGPERLSYSGGKDKNVEMVQPVCEPKWYVSIGVGTDFDTEETDFENGAELFFDFDNALRVPLFNDIYNRAIGSGHANVPDGFTLDGIELNFAHRNWDDVYNNAYRVEAEFGRVITNHIEIFGRFNYVHADGGTESGSNVTLMFSQPEAAPSGLGDFELVFPITTKFSDYNTYGGELGARFLFLQPDSPVRPYVSIAGGGTWTESIHAESDINVFGFEFNVYDDDFYHDTFVATGALMLGLQARVTCHFQVGVEAGIRYEGTLDGADIFENIFGDTEPATVANARPSRNGRVDGGMGSGDPLEELHHTLNSVNHDAGDRLMVPVVFWAKYRF